ncbi:PLP-dependent cysteine synthase family protein [Reichenbachiella ulvae]|uniref:Cysteine synthase family protein n=1 Tax=Reichenbachiella ulvae TaxID=2980104 RepID=A0ABT3CS66_9BACT|nr:cysteine synthase family protein [Reichenbachiella ulvae]MCV9386546.1 cysteine synthase family protein [Reichenbachiella ulvae]
MEISQDSQVLKSLESLGQFVGATPLFEVQHLSPKPSVKIFAKMEWMQFGGSVKTRPAYNIIKGALKSGELGNGKTLLDASSGNTALAYATIGARLGIPVTICLPENASWERKKLLKGLGVNIVYTSKFGSSDESEAKAEEMYRNDPDKYFLANQYGNENNWMSHYQGTGPEIYGALGDQITHFVTGLGTTGSFTGITKYLKEQKPDIKAIGLQPDGALHGLEGWKDMETAKVPGIYDKAVVDEIKHVDTYDAYDLIKETARREGLLLSPSSAANLKGAIDVANEIDSGVVVTLFPDNAEKYSEIIKSLF